MFKKTANNHYANDQGVEIVGISRDLFEYREGKRVLHIGRETAVGENNEPAVIVYLTPRMRWQPPHETMPLSSADIDRIAAHIVEAFAVCGLHCFISRKDI